MSMADPDNIAAAPTIDHGPDAESVHHAHLRHPAAILADITRMTVNYIAVIPPVCWRLHTKVTGRQFALPPVVTRGVSP